MRVRDRDRERKSLLVLLVDEGSAGDQSLEAAQVPLQGAVVQW